MASKKFDKDKNYRIGRKRGGGSSARINWTKKPAPKPISGSWLISKGIITTEDFWEKNPTDIETNVSVVIAEIIPETGDDLYLDEGIFMNRRNMGGAGLGDEMPNFGAPAPVNNAAIERNYNNHVNDLKDLLDKANERLNEQEKAFNKRAAEYEATIKEKDEENVKLKDKIRDLQTELKIEQKIAERLGTKLEDKGSLGDMFSGFGENTQHFQRAFGEKLADGVVNLVGNISLGKKPNPQAATATNPADTLGIPDV